MALPRLITEKEYSHDELVQTFIGDVGRADMFIVGGMTGETDQSFDRKAKAIKNDDGFDCKNEPYNCLGWVLYNAPAKPEHDQGGLEWHDLDDDIEVVTALLLSYGYMPTGAGDADAVVDVLGTRDEVHHVIRKFQGPYSGVLGSLANKDIWESKLDGYYRVTHPRKCSPQDKNIVVRASFKLPEKVVEKKAGKK